MALGVIFLIVGIVAIVVPAAASVGVAIFLGWVAPLKGTITRTVVLTVWFIATGIVRLFTAFRDRGTPAAGAMAVSGGVALILGILVALNLPSSSSWALGLLVGLDFLCFGWVLLVLANAARKLRAAR